MSIVGASPAEKEESGQRKREDFTEREGSGLENPEKKALSISTRLRRQISGVISALASLTKSGRLARVVINEQEQDDLEDSREIVALSLEAFAEGLQCVGGMAESLKNRAAANERNPFQLVVHIIDHTTRGMFDHPFFREASIGPRDTIMIEEAESAIMLHVRGSQGYQKVPCAALFISPEDLKPLLDEVVTMWSHFFGKEYDIACFYEREVFEKLEDLKERAKPLNRLFGGMI